MIFLKQPKKNLNKILGGGHGNQWEAGIWSLWPEGQWEASEKITWKGDI